GSPDGAAERRLGGGAHADDRGDGRGEAEGGEGGGAADVARRRLLTNEGTLSPRPSGRARRGPLPSSLCSAARCARGESMLGSGRVRERETARGGFADPGRRAFGSGRPP